MEKVKTTLMSSNITKTLYMSMLTIFTFMMCTPSLAFAAGEGGTGGSGTGLDSILKNVGTIAGVICGIILVIVLVKGVADYLKGESPIGKIVVKVLCILLLTGLIVTATNISTLQETFGGVANQAVDTVSDTADKALKG